MPAHLSYLPPGHVAPAVVHSPTTTRASSIDASVCLALVGLAMACPGVLIAVVWVLEGRTDWWAVVGLVGSTVFTSCLFGMSVAAARAARATRTAKASALSVSRG